MFVVSVLIDQKRHRQMFWPTFDPTVPTVIGSSTVEEDEEADSPTANCDVGGRGAHSTRQGQLCHQNRYFLRLRSNHQDISLEHPQGIQLAERKTKCYQFFVQEHDAFLLRERNRQAWFAFWGALMSQRSSSAIHGQLEIPELLQIIFRFLCGQPK